MQCFTLDRSVASVESDDLAGLAAEFRCADGSDTWRCWRGLDGTLYAWRLPSSLPLALRKYPALLRDRTVAGLRARMTEFGRVLAIEHRLDAAMAAAESLAAEEGEG